MIPTDSVLLAALSQYDADSSLVSNAVTFSFLGSGATIDTADINGEDSISLDWSEAQKDFVRDIFSYIATVVDVTFTELTDGSQGTMEFAQVEFLLQDTTGYSTPTGPGVSQLVMPTEYISLIDVTLIHEIGHSMGLSHPFDGSNSLPGVTSDGDLGAFELNTELATRMSYNPGAHIDHPGLDLTGEPSAFGALDIAALQLLYGANTSTGLGNTTYGDNPAQITIWDNSGTDTIDYSGATDNAVIDLRAATLELEAGGGGYLSFIGREGGTVANGGYTIAFGVEIENAIGGSADDSLTGNAIANMMTGGAGNDMLDGGAGVDTAAVSGNQGNYTLMLSAETTTLADRRADGDGTDMLVNMEAIAFGDAAVAPFDLTKFAGTAGLSEAQMESFVELYIAYFNRAPDAVGLNFWGTAFATGTTFEEMAALFTDQDETRATYAADLSNADFATAVYANVLGREADQEGFEFWTGVLDSGARSRDQFIRSVLEGAKTPIVDGSDETRAQQIADQQYLSIKTDIGAYFAVTKGLSDVDDARTAMATFDGSAGSVTTAQNAIDGYYADALAADSGEFILQLVGVIDDPFGNIVG